MASDHIVYTSSTPVGNAIVISKTMKDCAEESAEGYIQIESSDATAPIPIAVPGDNSPLAINNNPYVKDIKWNGQVGNDSLFTLTSISGTIIPISGYQNDLDTPCPYHAKHPKKFNWIWIIVVIIAILAGIYFFTTLSNK